jgi:hypothetical protein
MKTNPEAKTMDDILGFKYISPDRKNILSPMTRRDAVVLGGLAMTIPAALVGTNKLVHSKFYEQKETMTPGLLKKMQDTSDFAMYVPGTIIGALGLTLLGIAAFKKAIGYMQGKKAIFYDDNRNRTYNYQPQKSSARVSLFSELNHS